MKPFRQILRACAPSKLGGQLLAFGSPLRQHCQWTNLRTSRPRMQPIHFDVGRPATFLSIGCAGHLKGHQHKGQGHYHQEEIRVCYFASCVAQVLIMKTSLHGHLEMKVFLSCWALTQMTNGPGITKVKGFIKPRWQQLCD